MMRVLEDWLLLPQRFALHAPTATAVLADLHLGYSAARQWQGDAVPGRSIREEMNSLFEAAAIHEIRALVVAGDLFERGHDRETLTQFLAVLDALHIHFLGLVPGNHDRGVEKAEGELPLFTDGFEVGGWRIVHGDQPVDEGKTVMGHWHPSVRIRGRKAPCFLQRAGQIVLPAFSLDAAGVDVNKDPRWKDWTRYAISRNRIIAENGKTPA